MRHVFQLRRDLCVELELPRDLTTRDVHRLCRWLRCLPSEEDDFVDPHARILRETFGDPT